MTEAEAYEAGRAAYRAGIDMRSCPFPAPYAPPRTRADAECEAGGLGAFWLDGYEQERDSEED